MRVLKFIVDKQIIKQDPNCDFSGIVPGTEGYLKAEFSFSRDWDGMVKVVKFCSRLGREYNPQILEDGKTCLIPSDAASRRVFSIQILGKRDGSRMVTNKIVVIQNGGKK